MLLNQIDADFKQAMRDKNEIVVSSLRNLKSEIQNVEIDKRKELTEDEVISVIGKKVKQHRDSIRQFTDGGRLDLVETEQKQMAVLEKYLPAQMPEAELKQIVQAVKAELSPAPSDFGKVMKEVMNRVKGKADGQLVSKIVKEELSNM